MFDGLDQVDDSIITGNYTLGGLIYLGVTRIPTQGLKKGTYIK
jgi:hypothetical protein